MPTLTRRQFLQRSGIALGAMGLDATLGGPLALAAAGADRYVIFCYFEGAWDHLLGLDPRDPAIFGDDSMGETGIQPGYDRLPPQFSSGLVSAGNFTFGPCIGELAGVAEKISVIRGINMATLTHEVGRRYLLTGQPTSGNKARGASVTSLACQHIGDDRPVPHLALNVESYTDYSVAPFAAAMPIAAVDHLQYILRRDLGIPTLIRPGVQAALDLHWAREVGCDGGGIASSDAAAAYRDNRLRAHELVSSGLDDRFDFTSDESAGIRETYGFTADEREGSYGRAALAGEAIKSGLCRVVSVALTGGLDTHDGSWANTHSVNLNMGFNALARLITDLDSTEAPGGGSFLEKTTIFAFSEFGRESRINARNGRDHLLTNCAILAGAGIAPGVLVGSSSDNAMGPNLVNLSTGEASEEGVSLKPEHVMTTVLHAVGADPSVLKSEPLPTLLSSAS